MKYSTVIRQHWAALRALLVFTVVLGLAYPLLVWLIAQAPFLSDVAWTRDAFPALLVPDAVLRHLGFEARDPV